MKYRLLKDLPGLEKGSILSEYGSGSVLRILVAEEGKTVANFFSNEMFEKFFEEIKEPVDSIHYKPKDGDEYFYISDYGNVYLDNWNDKHIDNERLALGFIYPTEEECEKARERKLAKVRLQRTSDFKPDFENGEGGWIVFFSYMHKELHSMRESYSDSGEPVRYATEEEAKKSIKENREDWLTYFGVDPSDTNES